MTAPVTRQLEHGIKECQSLTSLIGRRDGARSTLVAAKVAAKKGNPLDRTQQWALGLAARLGHHKAAVALANKTARRLWAAEHHGTRFDPNHQSSRALPAY
jgi:hypothetical protein